MRPDPHPLCVAEGRIDFDLVMRAQSVAALKIELAEAWRPIAEAQSPDCPVLSFLGSSAAIGAIAPGRVSLAISRRFVYEFLCSEVLIGVLSQQPGIDCPS